MARRGSPPTTMQLKGTARRKTESRPEKAKHHHCQFPATPTPRTTSAT